MRNFDHFLTPEEEETLISFRHDLHRHPELSGEEEWTARQVAAFVGARSPDKMLTGLGGHGVAAIYEGAEPGPTLLVRWRHCPTVLSGNARRGAASC